MHLGARLRRRAADGLQQVHQLRQQGRHQRDRPAGIPGQGREDLGDRHVSGRRDQRPAIHRDRPRHLLGDPQADALPEVGPLARRRQGGEQPHRLAGRNRFGLRRAADPERRAAGGHDRRAVRLRGPVHHATLAARHPRGDHHQRRRPGHHGHRRGRASRPETGRTERGDQGQAQGFAPRHGLAPQSDRRDRRRPLRPLQGGSPHRAGRRQRGHGDRDPYAAVDDRHRGDRRRRPRGGPGNPQAGGLLVHGRQGRGARRGDPPRGGHSELCLPRGRRAGPGCRRPAGGNARHPPPRDDGTWTIPTCPGAAA